MINIQNDPKNRFLICLCACFTFMFLCHGFLLFNPSYSHDSLNEIVRDTGYFQTSLGRFLQRGWRSVFSSVTATWFIGIVTAVLCGFSAVMLSDLFHLKKVESLVFLSGLLVTNHCMIASVATYMPWVDTYGAALVFSVLGVWLLNRYRFGYFPGSLSLIVSMGLYPPYVICVPAIVVIQLIISLQQKRAWKNRLLYIAKVIFMLICAYVLYRIILKLILVRTGVAFSQADNSMANIKFLGFSHLTNLIRGAFTLFFSQLLETVSYLRFSYIIYGMIGISFVMIVLLFAIKARFGVSESVAMLILILIIPIVFNVQYIVCEEAVYHALMVYSIFFAYFLFIPLYDTVATQEDQETCTGFDRRKIRGKLKQILGKAYLCVPAILVIVLFADIRFANNVYTDKYLRERSTLSVMTRIMGAAEQTEGFDPVQSGVLIVGELDKNPIIASPNNAFYPILGNARHEISITYNIFPYLRNYMGYSYRFVDGQEKNNLLSLGDVQNMPAYPRKGFAKMLDDVLIIKISD